MAKMCCFSVFSPVSDDEIKSKVIKYLSDVDAAYNTDASFAIIYDKRTTTDRQFICFSNEISLAVFQNIDCGIYIKMLSPLILFIVS